MKKKFGTLIIFIFSTAALLISLKLFYNLAIFSDEYNSSPRIVDGGDFWLMMDWLRLVLLAAVSLISGIKLFRDKKR